jgi:hypothetical protein
MLAMKKIIFGFGVLCNAANIVSLWITYESAPDSVKQLISHKLTLVLGILCGIVYLVVGVLLLRSNDKPISESPDQIESAPQEPQIFISAQSTPVTIRFSDATVSFTIFSCSTLTLTFVELRLGTAIFKEVFQECIEAFDPRFITLSKTLNASEMEQLKLQLKISQTIQLFGTVKFGSLQRNFEFSTIPYFPSGMTV